MSLADIEITLAPGDNCKWDVASQTAFIKHKVDWQGLWFFFLDGMKDLITQEWKSCREKYSPFTLSGKKNYI